MRLDLVDLGRLNEKQNQSTTLSHLLLVGAKEHELAVNARVEITSSIFNLRVMSVSDSQNLYFIEFLKKFDKLNVRFNIEDVLRIYFDFKTRVNIES
jgi:hypothetical protein